MTFFKSLILFSIFFFPFQNFLVKWAPRFERSIERGIKCFLKKGLSQLFVITIFLLWFNILFISFSQLGYELDDEQLKNIFWRFKAIAEQKKVSRTFDDNLISPWKTKNFQCILHWQMVYFGMHLVIPFNLDLMEWDDSTISKFCIGMCQGKE